MKRDKSAIEFKKLVLGNAGKVTAKHGVGRNRKGGWDVMYGGSEDPALKAKYGRTGNFWVDFTGMI